MAKKTTAAAPMSDCYPPEYSHSIRTEQIKNGFLKHTSLGGPDVKGGYQRETTFHRKDPMGPARRAQIARMHAKITGK